MNFLIHFNSLLHANLLHIISHIPVQFIIFAVPRSRLSFLCSSTPGSNLPVPQILLTIDYRYPTSRTSRTFRLFLDFLCCLLFLF